MSTPTALTTVTSIKQMGGVWEVSTERSGAWVRKRRRTLSVAALIVVMKGALLPTFVFSLWNHAGVWAGMVSESQFLFEAVLLGFLAAATWAYAHRGGAQLALVPIARTAQAIA